VSDAGGTNDVVEWVRYLEEIGVRELHVPGDAAPRQEAAAEPPPAPRPEPRQEKKSRSADSPQAQAVQSALPLMGAEEPPADPAAKLEEIRANLGECTRCKLHEHRTNIVFGVGSPRAKLMFVGEGPGADEDAQGEPFVGRAGKKLDEMITAIGLRREDVYIANIIKCRPPDNRDPQPDEVGTCAPFLFEQIAAIRPRVIVALGSPAAKTLLNTRVGITRLRGTWHSYAGVPVMPTFHPAYLLRAYTPENRRKVWEDLKAARARLDASP
jgi:uracil-DNA glycosylase family 4